MKLVSNDDHARDEIQSLSYAMPHTYFPYLKFVTDKH